MTNPSERAREPELLAREHWAQAFDDDGWKAKARDIRAGNLAPDDERAIRAIVKALTPTPVEAGSGEIELVARALCERQLRRTSMALHGKTDERWLAAHLDTAWTTHVDDAQAAISALSRSPVTRDGE